MDHDTHNKIVTFIWSIADDCLLEDTKESIMRILSLHEKSKPA
jgi:hypothetical protein